MKAARNKLNYLSEPVEENVSTGFYVKEACTDISVQASLDSQQTDKDN